VLIVLLIIPGGLASLVIKIRDWYVDVVLRHRGTEPPDVVPSAQGNGTHGNPHSAPDAPVPVAQGNGNHESVPGALGNGNHDQADEASSERSTT
jgi:hypothetical protein